MKEILQGLCPPLLWSGLRKLRYFSADEPAVTASKSARKIPMKQELDLYSDPDFADVLDIWGAGTTWSEIQLIMHNARGRAIDIACGTGTVIEILAGYDALDVYGCDISDLLIRRAIERGIPKDRLSVCDATATGYDTGYFDYGYSIGSLEHFTEEGIEQFIIECSRITTKASFHNTPVSRSNKDEGWITPRQSYFNNSVEWWVQKFKRSYGTVRVLDSKWEDSISVGKWFCCSSAIK